MADDDYNAVALMDEVAARNSGRDTAATLADINSRLSDVEDAFESPSFDVDWRSAVVPEDSVGGGGIFEETSLPFGYTRSAANITVTTGKLILRAFNIVGKTTTEIAVAEATKTILAGTAVAPYWLYVEHTYGDVTATIELSTSATRPEPDETTFRRVLYSVYLDSGTAYVLQRHQWGDIETVHDEFGTLTAITGWKYDKATHYYRLTTQLLTVLQAAAAVGPTNVDDADGGLAEEETV